MLFPFMLLPVLYFATALAIAAFVVAALWRIMRAHEATAEALHQIAEALSRR